MISQVMALWWGTEPKPFPRLIPQEFAQGIGDQKYWLPVLAAAVCAGSLELFYRRTMYGKLFIATSEDAFAARALGINTDRVRALSYMLSGALGGLAGFAAGQLTFAYFALGFALTLNGFIAIAVGGLGSNLGAVIGGLALGMMSSFATYLFGGEYQQTVAIGILILVLVIKPKAPTWHVHPQAPLKIRFEAPPALKLAKAELGRRDAVDPKAEEPRFEAPFVASAAGEQPAKANVDAQDLALCATQGM
jgi:branched-subunit amino acid ABC-type transport system permease component